MTSPESSSPVDPFDLLIERAKASDKGALDELFRRCYGTVEEKVHRELAIDVRSGRPWISARFSTADIVQDTFHGVLRDLDSFRGSGERAFIGYLSMVVRNRIVDAIRYHEADRRDGRRGSSSTMRESDHPSKGEDPALAAEASDEHEVYLEALRDLPEREQLLVRARLEGQASFEELTEALGFSSVTTARRAFASAKSRIAMILHRRSGQGSTMRGGGASRG